MLLWTLSCQITRKCRPRQGAWPIPRQKHFFSLNLFRTVVGRASIMHPALGSQIYSEDIFLRQECSKFRFLHRQAGVSLPYGWCGAYYEICANLMIPTALSVAFATPLPLERQGFVRSSKRAINCDLSNCFQISTDPCLSNGRGAATAAERAVGAKIKNKLS